MLTSDCLSDPLSHHSILLLTMLPHIDSQLFEHQVQGILEPLYLLFLLCVRIFLPGLCTADSLSFGSLISAFSERPFWLSRRAPHPHLQSSWDNLLYFLHSTYQDFIYYICICILDFLHVYIVSFSRM